jgi:hypothetical protein
VIVFLLASSIAGSAFGALPMHTKRRAELNILRSPNYFWQAGLHRLIRTRTRTFRTNVTVSCGRRLAPLAREHVFVCVLRYHADRIRIRYTALGAAKRFRLKILSV